MMWFKKKSKRTYSEFWERYKSYFNKTFPEMVSEITFTAFDTETTGLNIKKDRVLSIGAVKIKDSEIAINSVLDLYLEQTVFNPDTVKIHGIIQNHNFEKIPELDAVKEFLEYIENSVLVGHHIFFDISMINEILKRHNLPLLMNKYLDTSTLFKQTKVINYLLKNDQSVSLDYICEELFIDMSDRHTALGDAYITALAFLKIMSKLSPNNQINRKSLFSRKYF